MDETELLTTKVPRALEMKSKLFGFELPDLLLIFFNLAITNLIFGTTSFRYPLVWGSSVGLALFLYFAKTWKARKLFAAPRRVPFESHLPRGRKSGSEI